MLLRLKTNNIKNKSDNKRWNKWAWRALSWKDTDQCATGILYNFVADLHFSIFPEHQEWHNHAITNNSEQNCVATIQIGCCAFSIPGVAIMTWEVKSGSHAGAENLHMMVQKIWMSQLKSKCPSWIYMRNDTKLEYPRKNIFIKVGREPNYIKFVWCKVGRLKTKNFKIDNFLFCSWQ